MAEPPEEQSRIVPTEEDFARRYTLDERRMDLEAGLKQEFLLLISCR
jgi:hypothetical protein